MAQRAMRGLATAGEQGLPYRSFREGQRLVPSLLKDASKLGSDAMFLEHLFNFLSLEPIIQDPHNPHGVPRVSRGHIAMLSRLSTLTFVFALLPADTEFPFFPSEQLAVRPASPCCRNRDALQPGSPVDCGAEATHTPGGKAS